MEKEEKIIRQFDNGRNPFSTPEGYFESFTDRLMKRIADEQLAQVEPERVKVVPLSPWRRMMKYAAAVAVMAAAVGGGSLLYDRADTSDPLLSTDAIEYAWDDEDLDEVLDYEMLDNQQIAYYLTEAY